MILKVAKAGGLEKAGTTEAGGRFGASPEE